MYLRLKILSLLSKYCLVILQFCNYSIMYMLQVMYFVYIYTGGWDKFETYRKGTQFRFYI